MSSLRDKADTTRGLILREGKQISTYQNLINIDTRDCVGSKSLQEAKIAFQAQGGRSEATGIISTTTGIGVSPIKITTFPTTALMNGDMVFITGVQGNTVCNNEWKINNVNPTFFEIGGIGNGNYAGGGQWTRPSDNGYPTLNETTCTVIGNEMIIMLQKRLKAIKSVALNVSIIPRDIIPIASYYTDLYTMSTGGTSTFIPQEIKYMMEISRGFYSTPLSIFRSYEGLFNIPNQVTPPPLQLWNPLVGVWPLQPLPYYYQTVPTYQSGEVSIGGILYHIVCSGYGVYDLNDWTKLTRADTEIARRALLVAIVRPQTYKDLNYIDIINNLPTTSNNISPYGYGLFQRFVCGPGLQLNYQPGTSDSTNPTIAAPDWPIAFPDFRGNIWGPYDTPGDRFQRMGLRDTIQDLFLNGDLDNLFGDPIVSGIGAVPTVSNNTVNFANYSSATNLNILNAMRIVPNGFGAASVIAQGQGNPLSINAFLNSGGIGPSSLGPPNAWSTSGIFGAPSYTDPNAVGPLSWNLLTNGTIPQTSVANLPPNNSQITHRFSSFDLGPNQGAFKLQLKQYHTYAALNLPSTNLVIQAFQFPRNERSQSTNSQAGTSILNIPIRLLPETAAGGFDYVESLFNLLTQTSDLEYWGQRFLSPLASLDKINLKFFTYEGMPIPLEKILSYDTSKPSTSPLLHSRRYISLTFRAEVYSYVLPGLILEEQVAKILNLGSHDKDNDDDNFMVKAANFTDYA